MSSRTPVELDFLGLRGPASAAAADQHQAGSSSTPSSSVRGMKTSATASIGARQLRRVIVGAEPPPPKPAPTMTLFYDGAVASFNVSQDKAEAIMKMAAAEATDSKRHGRGNAFLGNFAKDIPLTRTRSLQQFLQKRKQRLTSLGPYQLGLGLEGTAGGVGAANKSFHVKEEAA